MARPGGQRRSGRARTDTGGQNRDNGAQRSNPGAQRTNPAAQRRRAPRPSEQGIIPVLAGVAREVDNAMRKPPPRPGVRTKFQVVALLVREERARVMADRALTESRQIGRAHV